MWKGNQRGSTMISTGTTGTPLQGIDPNSASRLRVKTLLCAAPPSSKYPLARPSHVRFVSTVANHLQGVVGLDASADVRCAVMKQRPAAVPRLNAAKVVGDLCFQSGVYRLAEVVAHQNVFGRNCRVGFEFEYEMTVFALQLQQRAARGRYCGLQIFCTDAGTRCAGRPRHERRLSRCRIP